VTRVVAPSQGLTFGELWERLAPLGPPLTARALRYALRDEVERGRMLVDQEGRYSLAPNALPPDVIEALQTW
jgi:hypothetical protein